MTRRDGDQVNVKTTDKILTGDSGGIGRRMGVSNKTADEILGNVGGAIGRRMGVSVETADDYRNVRWQEMW